MTTAWVTSGRRTSSAVDHNMAKVLILVEGQTEETFVKRTLEPHLSSLGVFLVPTIIATKRIKSGPSFKGGIPSYAKVRREILRLLGDSSAALVTTMIDFYGLPASFPGRANVHGKTSIERVVFVENAIEQDINDPRFLAYCSLHEFEALLFSSPATIAAAFAMPTVEQKLLSIRAQFTSPEEIDDHPSTAPSARLQLLYPQYSKPFYGTLIAGRIGLDEMRGACAHFNDWLVRLEALSA
jgi:uncharacterized protein DUF4276